MAGEFLRKERPKEEVAVLVDQVSGGFGPDGEEIFQTRIHASLAPREAQAAEKEVDVFVAEATNVRKVAVFVARSLSEGGPVPALHAMGPAAVAQALKAAAIARGFVASDDPALGGRGAAAGSLAFLPRMRKVYGESRRGGGVPDQPAASRREPSGGPGKGPKLVEFILRCRRALLPGGPPPGSGPPRSS